MIFASPLGLAVGAPIWLVLFAGLRISSLAALAAAAVVPVGAWLLGETAFAVGVLGALSVLVFWTHRANIGRLLKGTEPRFGASKEK